MAADGLRRAAGPYTRGEDDYLRCWWEWVTGSTPFFWNWPERYATEVRDGQPHFLVKDPTKLPAFQVPQAKPRTDRDLELVQAKIIPVRRRGYIGPGPVDSLIHYFYVPKGLDDVRIVYNGTGCGLNEAIWAPHFGLPYVTHTLRSLMPGYFQCDLDIGEMFLNYLLHDDLKRLSGVDVQHVRSTDPGDKCWESPRINAWERWNRSWMGLGDSPYRCIQWMIRLKMISYGNPADRTNPFHWDRVELNLPGTAGYRPHLPWVMKVRWDGHLAAELFKYVDDARAMAFCLELCWAAVRRFSTMCSHLGIQDRAAKRTWPSITPGPWAGTVCHTDGGEVSGRVSQEKWEKMKSQLGELQDMIRRADAAARSFREKPAVAIWDSEGRHGRRRGAFRWAPSGKRGYKDFWEDTKRRLHRPRLEEIRGFLNYVVRTYPWMNPYLKGLHLTIDGWRPDRAKGGWRVPRAQMAARRACDHETSEVTEDPGAPKTEDTEGPTAPATVAVQPRLRRDVQCLLLLTETPAPPRERYRAQESTSAFYMPGDASGKGFGSALITPGKVYYEAGTWAPRWQRESSNFREADNLVTRVEELVGTGVLRDQELFLFTDNWVFENCFYKGHSGSERLSDIILRLHLAQRSGLLRLHVIHVAGTRMKAWGVDGLSRGDTMEGLMAGCDPLSFVPIGQNALTRAGLRALRGWVDGWWNKWLGTQLTLLTPDLWFQLWNVPGPRFWAPPPAAMEAVMEVFNEDHLAHPWIPHVFVIPRLMTHLWRKLLGKDADLMFTLEVGDHFWSRRQHEPLIVAVVLPFAHRTRYFGPWVARYTPEAKKVARELENGFKWCKNHRHRGLHDMGGSLCEMWKDPEGRSRDLLQEFLRWAGGFPPVLECVVRGVLRGGSERPVPSSTGS